MNAYSVYIHLPFCHARCPYCDFFSTDDRAALFEDYLEAVHAEWRMRRRELVNVSDDELVTTLYVGGGTPSLWPADSLVSLLGVFPMGEQTEVTVEANPGDWDASWYQTLTDGGVNRFSIGAQAMDAERLVWLGRRHDVSMIEKAVAAAKKAGAGSVSADIIYGTPGHTPRELTDELNALCDLGVNHVSAYELTVASGTALHRSGLASEELMPGEEMMIELWRTVGDVLAGRGIERYEVSSYGAPGHRSRHNCRYWTGGTYVGLGAGAHGFMGNGRGGTRYGNPRDVEGYLRGAGERERLLDLDGAFNEAIGALDHARELLMLGLRTADGIDLQALRTLMDEADLAVLVEAARCQIGLLVVDEDRIRPTDDGLLQADELATRLT